MVHNRYRQPGGEDQVACSEVENLREGGLEVLSLTFHNDANGRQGVASALRLATAASWSQASYRRIQQVCDEYRPDIAHVHNFWMKLSPAVHAACREVGVPSVQTLHNFRLLCTNALFLRKGQVCEDCLGKVPWRGVVRRCYRNSVLASAAVVRMIVSNRNRGTWDRDVSAFIALSRHSRSKFVAGGLPADRLFVKPNFVFEPGEFAPRPSSSNLILYLGRLSNEKGIETLLIAWAAKRLDLTGQLLIVGDGPSREALERQACDLELDGSGVTFVGRKQPSEIPELLASARAVVLPSLCYENFPRSVVEAFSCGRPVVSSDLGAPAEIVAHGETGLKFPVGDAAALGDALKTILSDDALADRLGTNARAEYLAKYTPAHNFEMLMRIYRFAIEHRGNSVPEMLRAFEPATTSQPKILSSAAGR